MFGRNGTIPTKFLSSSFLASTRDYRLLGLDASETRVDIIRTAAERSAHRASLICSPNRKERFELQIAMISLAAYRLLDPRRRERPSERVQLCYPIDRDDVEVAPIEPLAILNSPMIQPSQLPAPNDKVQLPANRVAVIRTENSGEHIDRSRSESSDLNESRSIVRSLRSHARREFNSKARAWIRRISILLAVFAGTIYLAILAVALRGN